MRSRTTTKLIGNFGVDSGQVIIVDPCYLHDWVDENHDSAPGFDFDAEVEKATGKFSYLGACNATLTDAGAGQLGKRSAVVSSTGYGDGCYPVYATYNTDGRIIKLEVFFDGDPYEESEEDEELDEYSTDDETEVEE